MLLASRRILTGVLFMATVATGIAVAGTSATAAPPATTSSPAVSAPADAPGTLTSSATGTFTDATGQPGTFVGTFVPASFTQQGDALLATGTVTGTLTDSAGKVLGTTSAPATTAVTSAVGSCQVLDLVLAPLDLNLLGLTVHLDRVHLNITAVPGPGNLLGNLLCAITHLLDGGSSLGALSALLNQILAILNL